MEYDRPQCSSCKHFNVGNFNGLTCRAFPKGIPDEILMNEKAHNKILPGQTGNYVFEEKNK